MNKTRRRKEFIDELYARHAGLMFKSVLDFGVAKTTADDIVSSGLILLMQKADRLMKLNEGKLRAYIVTTMRRAAIDALNRETLRRRKEASACELEYSRTDPFTKFEDALFGDDMLDRALTAIEQLPPRQRACVKLKYLLDKTDAQIALETGLSKSSIRQYISRARKRLRKELDIDGKGGRDA